MERLGSTADMIMTTRRKFALGAFAFAIACQGEALAQDGAKPKPLIPDKVIENEIARYCTNFVPLEAEARVAYQTRLLIELDYGFFEIFNVCDENVYDFHDQMPAGNFVPCI